MKYALLISVTIFIVLSVFSCVTVDEGVVGKDTAPTLLKNLERYNDSVRSVTGTAAIFYKEPGRTLSFRASVTRQNDDIRLDLRDFVFKKPIITLVKVSEDVLVINYQKHEYYRMKYNRLDLESLAGIAIDPDVLIPSVTGSVFIESSEKSISSIDGNTLRIDSTGVNEVVQFNELSLPENITIDVPPVLYSLSLTKFTQHDNVYFPYKIVLTVDENTLEITYSDVTINSADTAAFDMDSAIPHDFTRVEVSDAKRPNNN